ncbi:hypothetical protein [Anaerocaecibacter muris]|uniref:hypothetical protein n=1 Tax=Anaerocaecibacter muris TaxID=2941513 RepID=UPI0020411CB3|nr:hypothetical protein [Anaerocaecibacter muris]
MEKYPNNSEERNKLEEEIKRLESSAFGSVGKPTLSQTALNEIEYTPPTDEYLAVEAENSLANDRADQIQAIRDRSENEVKQNTAVRDAYISDRDGERATLAENYEAAVRAVDNDAIKRGLARSSVAAVGRSELEREYLKRNADVEKSYGKKIAELDGEIAAADGKLRAALDDFNLSYATRLNQKIAELKAERDQKIERVTSFNNSVREKQAKLDADKLKTESDLFSAAIEQKKKANSADGLSASERDKLFKSVYDSMDKYLASLDKQEAKLEIRNHTLYRQHLSNYYYTKLYDKYGR